MSEWYLTLSVWLVGYVCGAELRIAIGHVHDDSEVFLLVEYMAR